MKKSQRQLAREKRKTRIRKKLFGTAERPRLSIFRSARYVYAQLIDDESGKTLCASSSLEKAVRGGVKSPRSVEASTAVGKAIADKAKAAKIENVVFDRNGFIFHGRVKAIADGAREAGLKF
jgi:large subunit ribosomal protein L18